MNKLAVATLALVMAGCSLFLKGVKDDWTPRTDPDCQPYIIVPIVDAVVGAAALTWAVTAACDDDGASCVLGLAPGAVFAGAAVWGYFKVKRCERAQEQFQRGGGVIE